MPLVLAGPSRTLEKGQRASDALLRGAHLVEIEVHPYGEEISIKGERVHQTSRRVRSTVRRLPQYRKSNFADKKRL
jgi:hypothetical protein